MKPIVVAFLLVLVFLNIHGNLYAREEEKEKEGKKYSVNLSFQYPAGINKTKIEFFWPFTVVKF